MIPALLRLILRPIAGLGVFASQVLRSAHRTDLPSHNNQDPGGTFGDPASPHLEVVMLGDSSITAPGVVPIEESWPRRVAEHLARRFHVKLTSVAVGGAKMRHVLEEQLPRALDLGGDIALVSAGANDALRGTPVARFEAELAEILDSLTSTFPRVGLAGVGDLGTMPRLPDLARSLARVRARSIDDAILRVADSRPGVVKARSWGGPWRHFVDDAPVAFAADQFHASGAGHAVFAASMVPVVDALVDGPTPVNEWRGNPGSAT